LGYREDICQKLNSFKIGSIVQYCSSYCDDNADGNWVSFGSYGVILKTIMTADGLHCTAKVYWFDDESYSFVSGQQIRLVC
jgi:hypothetical protein